MATGGEESAHGWVMEDTHYSFKRFMKSKFNKLVATMLKKKILKKKLGKFILRLNDSDLLLGYMKQIMSLRDFCVYLEVLIDLGSSEPADTEGGTRALMRIMAGSLEAMKPEPGSKLEQTITRFIVAAFLSSKQIEQTPLQSHSETQPRCPITRSTSAKPALTGAKNPAVVTATPQMCMCRIPTASIRPPAGQTGDTNAGFFTRNGGVLYSSQHGVSVVIPANSTPANLKRYYLGMHIYYDGPFTFPDGSVACSVVIWLHQSPKFVFSKEVTINIPHTINGDDFEEHRHHVLTLDEDGKGPTYNLSKVIPADFSEPYHAVFKVRNFSPYAVVGKQAKKEPVTQEKLSVSMQEAVKIDDINQERRSKKNYNIAMLMPVDRSGTDWKVTFAACYDSCIGDWVLRKSAEQMYGKGCFEFRCTSFQTCREYVEFAPPEWKGDSNSWRVLATEANVITTENIERVPSDTSKPEFKELIASGLYPPSVTYSVQCDANPPDGRLNCRIEVEGAKTANGKSPFFVLTPSVRKHTKHFTQERILFTSSYLYGEDSDIRKALNSANSDIHLDTLKPDHIKFLADISCQITDAPRLSQALGLQDYQLQRIRIESDNAHTNLVTYRLLATWVCRKGQDARLSAFKMVLSTIGYRDILLRDHHDATATNEGGADLLINLRFDLIPLPNLSSSLSSTTTRFERNFVCRLPEKLQCCWRSVGRLMGIPDLDLDTVAMEHHSLYEQSYHMIYEWQKKNRSDIMYGTLFKAITCLFDHCPDRINAAHCYVVERIEQLLSVRCQ